MRQQQLVEIKGMDGNDYNFTLSGAGKLLASERFQITQYAGARPDARSWPVASGDMGRGGSRLRLRAPLRA